MHIIVDNVAIPQDDFRSLFTANEKLKTEYKSLQSDYKSLKSENNALKLKQTEVSGQMCDNRDHINGLEVEISKLSNRCEVRLVGTDPGRWVWCSVVWWWGLLSVCLSVNLFLCV